MVEKQIPYKLQIYDEIKDNIIAGKYKSGYLLNERKLADQLGISRTPVREAIQLLAQDGWLTMESYRGASIRVFDIEYMRNIHHVRTALECCVVEEAVENIKETDIEELKHLQKMQQDAIKTFQPREFIELDRKYHAYLYGLSKNDELVRLLKNYYDLFLYAGIQAVSSSKERKMEVLTEHQKILDALILKDPKLASDAMRAHMITTEQNMIFKMSHISEDKSESE